MTVVIEVRTVVLKAAYCPRPGPSVEVTGAADVTVKWRCACGCYHSAVVKC